MKKLIIPITVLFVICLGLGVFGFILNKKGSNKDDLIQYKYIVNKEKQQSMPGEFEGFEFDKYKCTNGVKGKWDEKKWDFKVSDPKKATCTLYFKQKEYEVELTVAEGITVSGNSLVKVKKDEPAEFAVAVGDGKKIDKVECTNEQTAVYDSAAGKIKLETVTDDTVCSVSTGTSSHTAEVKALYGKVSNSKQTVEHGKNVIFVATPDAGYTFDTVSCTNGQKPSYANGKLSVSNVTTDTVCTVSFKTSNFNVKVNAKNGLVSGGAMKPVELNGTVSFTVTPNSGFTYQSYTCNNGQKGTWNNNAFVVNSVTKNTVCTVNFIAQTN